MPLNIITIATRGSRLAMWQAEHIGAALRKLGQAAGREINIAINIIKTKGDIIQDVPLSKVGGKGLFVKEIEEALLDGRADLAVHSMKDVPMELPEGLILGAIPLREDPCDVLLSATSPGLSALPSGAQIGTSSLRRQAQILARRPDVRVVPLRGNIDTRLRKLREGQFDAIVMAAAGIRRLELDAPYMERLASPRFLPAAGQGALGLEIRADREDLLHLLAPLEDPETRVCVEAERGFLSGLNGSCQVPIAAHAILAEDGSFTLHGLVAHTDGSVIVSRTATLPTCPDPAAARALGLELAAQVFENGGRSVLNTVLYTSDAPVA